MRIDLFLAEQGYAPSRQRAKGLIAEGGVTVDGKIVKKPSEEIDEQISHQVEIVDGQKYVGRGGLKLEGALRDFGLDVSGLSALDIGASTGGFTDCLLEHGAKHVIAVDAGVGQLAKKLCDDVRVTSIERMNARDLSLDDIGGARVDLIVMDVSFISATYIIPRYPALLKEGGEAICLIKPQFEVGRAMLGKGGLVKDASAHRFAVERVLACALENGLTPVGLIASPIRGGDGNREFLVRLQYGNAEKPAIDSACVRRIVGG